MANYCSTYIYIESNRKTYEELEELFNRFLERDVSIDQVIEDNREYLEAFPLEDELFEELDAIVEDIYVDTDPSGKECLTIHTITKWKPELMIFSRIMDVIDPQATILYDAEEPGTGLYWTNVPEYENCVTLDYSDDSLISGFEAHETYPWEMVREYLGNRFPNVYKSNMSIDDLNKALSDADIDLAICEWEMVDIDELCDDDSEY